MTIEIFLREKKKGAFRPTINLKRVNENISYVNGDPEEHQDSFEGKQLDGKNGPQGRLLHSTNHRKLPKVNTVFTGGEHLRISVHDESANVQ